MVNSPWPIQTGPATCPTSPGQHELVARATDADGATQPLEQEWNVQGMANNLVRRVPVAVLR